MDKTTEKPKFWKVVIEPNIDKRFKERVFRFEGKAFSSEYDFLRAELPIIPKDPRIEIKCSPVVKLQVPVYVKNEWSSKEPPPPIEVVLWNLNDNIDEKFLRKHCEVYGEITRIKVYRHNVTNKHLQFGKVRFKSIAAARKCYDAVNESPIMGMIVSACRKGAREKLQELFDKGHGVEKRREALPDVIKQSQQPKVNGEVNHFENIRLEDHTDKSRSRLSGEENHTNSRHYQHSTRLNEDGFKGRERPHHRSRQYSGETGRRRHPSWEKHHGNRYFDDRHSNEQFYGNRYVENINHEERLKADSLKDRRIEDRYHENRSYDNRFAHDRNVHSDTYHNGRYHNDKRSYQRTHHAENFKPNDVPVYEKRYLEHDSTERINEHPHLRPELDIKTETSPLVNNPSIQSFEEQEAIKESPLVQSPLFHREDDGGDFKKTESEAELVEENSSTKKSKKHKKKKKSHKKKHKKNKKEIVNSLVEDHLRENPKGKTILEPLEKEKSKSKDESVEKFQPMKEEEDELEDGECSSGADNVPSPTESPKFDYLNKSSAVSNNPYPHQRYPSGFFPPPKRVAEVPPNIKADVDLRRRPATAALATPISFLPSDDALPRPYPAAVEKKRSSSGSLSAEVVNAGAVTSHSEKPYSPGDKSASATSSRSHSVDKQRKVLSSSSSSDDSDDATSSSDSDFSSSSQSSRASNTSANEDSDDDKPQQTLDERLAEIMMSQEDDHNDKDSVKGVDMEMSSEPEEIQERKTTPEQPPPHAIPQQQITQPRPPIAQPIPVLPKQQSFRGPTQNVRADVSGQYAGNVWTNSHQYAVRHQYHDVNRYPPQDQSRMWGPNSGNLRFMPPPSRHHKPYAFDNQWNDQRLRSEHGHQQHTWPNQQPSTYLHPSMIPQQPQHAYYNHIPGPYQQQGIDRYYPKMNEPSVIDQKPILIDSVMARLRPDFQEVMKKDLMKKFIEQVAYKKMEEWYEHKLFVFKGAASNNNQAPVSTKLDNKTNNVDVEQQKPPKTDTSWISRIGIGGYNHSKAMPNFRIRKYRNNENDAQITKKSEEDIKSKENKKPLTPSLLETSSDEEEPVNKIGSSSVTSCNASVATSDTEISDGANSDDEVATASIGAVSSDDEDVKPVEKKTIRAPSIDEDDDLALSVASPSIPSVENTDEDDDDDDELKVIHSGTTTCASEEESEVEIKVADVKSSSPKKSQTSTKSVPHKRKLESEDEIEVPVKKAKIISSSDEYEPPVVARKANLDDTLTNSEGGDSDVPTFDKKRCRFYSHDNNTNNLQNGFKESDRKRFMSERDNNKQFEVAEILIGLRTLINKEKNEPKYKYQQPETPSLSAEIRNKVLNISREHNYCRLQEVLPRFNDGPGSICERVFSEHSYSYHPLHKANKENVPIKNNSFVTKLKSPTVSPLDKAKDNKKHNLKRKREDNNLQIKMKKCFKKRTVEQDNILLNNFFMKGIDDEDLELLRESYQNIQVQAAPPSWAFNTHWSDHPPTLVPPPTQHQLDLCEESPPARTPSQKRKKNFRPPEPHKTGCARSEGYYKLNDSAKAKQKRKMYRQADNTGHAQSLANSIKQQEEQVLEKSREARHMMRRIAYEFGNEASDMLKYNQLMLRKKAVKFQRSSIHGWGLFAQEIIRADEMVIEYVGELVRSEVAERREVDYTVRGIGSSYLFRIDTDHIIDATKKGNYARFMNHSCNPSCYAKVITVENQSKIVIYSKDIIKVGEEITYDYKFPIEDEKIPCYCGAHNCRGTLN